MKYLGDRLMEKLSVDLRGLSRAIRDSGQSFREATGSINLGDLGRTVGGSVQTLGSMGLGRIRDAVNSGYQDFRQNTLNPTYSRLRGDFARMGVFLPQTQPGRQTSSPAPSPSGGLGGDLLAQGFRFVPDAEMQASAPTQSVPTGPSKATMNVGASKAAPAGGAKIGLVDKMKAAQGGAGAKVQLTSPMAMAGGMAAGAGPKGLPLAAMATPSAMLGGLAAGAGSKAVPK